MFFVKTGRSTLLIGCMLGIGLAFLLLWPFAVAWGQEPEASPTNLDVILLIDNSRSMSEGEPKTGVSPSDPENLRIQAAKFLVDYLSVSAETLEANYRVGVVSFGGLVNQEDVAPLRLLQLQDDTVREGIRSEMILYTNFCAPLGFARREFKNKSFGTENRMAVILFTDGRPQLTDNPVTEEEKRAHFEDLACLVERDLQEEGVSVFVVGIQDAPEDRDNWIEIISQDRYFSVTTTEQLVGVCHQILADLTGAAVPQPTTIPPRQAVSVDAQPYLERVLFSFIKSDPASDITLISPTGKIVPCTIGGTAGVHHAIYSEPNPDPGEWKVLWKGEGEVWYWVSKERPFVDVDLARLSSPVGQPITITASLERNGEPVIDPDLQLEAQITPPDGDVVIQHLSSAGGGMYVGSYQHASTVGLYTVTARAFLNDQRLTARAVSVTVEVFPLPTSTLEPSLTPTSTPTPTQTRTPTPTPTEEPNGPNDEVLLILVIGISIAVAVGFIAVWLIFRKRWILWVVGISMAVLVGFIVAWLILRERGGK